MGGLLTVIFSGDVVVVARAAEYLKGFAPETVITSILFGSIGCYSGHSKILFVMPQGIAQTLIVRWPMPIRRMDGIGLLSPLLSVDLIVAFRQKVSDKLVENRLHKAESCGMMLMVLRLFLNYMQRYRSGHNGADLKSARRLYRVRAANPHEIRRWEVSAGAEFFETLTKC